MTKPLCKISQGFGENAVNAYFPLKGHTGVDSGCGYGTSILSYYDKEYVYKVLDKDHPANDGSGFTGVFTLVEKDGEVFEFLYGHCNPLVTVGQILTKGTLIGTEANNGEVYQNGERITLEMQKAGDTRGSHRHDQKRPLKKMKGYDMSKRYLTDKYGLLLKDGFLYEIVDYDNGYNGCVDWTIEKPHFDVDLKIGQSGEEVSKMQEFLIEKGFMARPNTLGFYGPITAKALLNYQLQNTTLSWYERYILKGSRFGPKTREAFNK